MYLCIWVSISPPSVIVVYDREIVPAVWYFLVFQFIALGVNLYIS
jgi:hypothetical protein